MSHIIKYPEDYFVRFQTTLNGTLFQNARAYLIWCFQFLVLHQKKSTKSKYILWKLKNAFSKAGNVLNA